MERTSDVALLSCRDLRRSKEGEVQVDLVLADRDALDHGLDNRQLFPERQLLPAGQGLQREPFRGMTLPPIKVPVTGRREIVRQRSREKYALLRAMVEEKIERWLEAA